jgi:hypothetical protein
VAQLSCTGSQGGKRKGEATEEKGKRSKWQAQRCITWLSTSTRYLGLASHFHDQQRQEIRQSIHFPILLIYLPLFVICI